jgi:uridine kinase
VTSCLVVGIAGGSGSGKTTLARDLLDRLTPLGGLLVPADAYYRDLSHLSVEERAGANFDHPDALDVALLRHHLDELRSGRAVCVPRYDFASHTRTGRGEPVGPAPLVLVEGVMILALESIRTHLDLRVYVEAASAVRLERRVQRDSRVRGRNRASVLRQWDATVAPMHEEWVAPSRRHAHLVVSGEESATKAVAALLGDIRRRLGLGPG